MAADYNYADLNDADPVPRELTPTSRRYAAMKAPMVYLVLAVVFVVFPTTLAAALLRSRDSLYLLVPLFGAIAYGWSIVRERAQIHRAYIHGVQRPARIARMSQLALQTRYGGSARRVSILLEVDGRHVWCVSWSGDLEDAEQGAWIRVLVDPHSQLVIPVVSVT